MRQALPAGSTVSVLGADGSGASTLARALAIRLQARHVTVLDDTPLRHAIDRELRLGDRSLHDDALNAHRRHACTLLVGLDAHADAQCERTDALLRAALAGAGLPFAVIHGQGGERLANALRALGLEAPEAPRRIAPFDCDKCSDPVCEHRLFTDLLRRRVDAGSASA